MALQANITLDLNKKNTTSPRVQLRQSDQNYPSITVQVTENGQPFNGTTWEAAFEGMTSSGKFIHDNSHFDKSTTPATGTYTYVPPLQVSSDVGAFELAYLVFEKAGSPKQRTTTANFRFNIIEQADINAGAAKDYVSTWQSADAKMKALQKSMEAAAAAYKGTVDTYVKDFGTKVTKINGDIVAAETRITNMVNSANKNLQNVLTSNNTFTGENTFNNSVTINNSANLIQDLSIHVGTRANPVNVDNMTGGEPALKGNPGIHVKIIFGDGGTPKPYTGTLPNTNDLAYSILENMGGTTGSVRAQRWTSFTSNRIYTRTFSGNPAKWSTWKQLAHDDELVHNTGNEIVNGVKTFVNPVWAPAMEIGNINQNPIIDFHTMEDPSSDYRYRITGTTQKGLYTHDQDTTLKNSLTMVAASDANPLNIDTMVGGVPNLSGNTMTVTAVAQGGVNPFTGTLPAGLTNWVALEHTFVGPYNATQRLIDTNTGLTFIRVLNKSKWAAWRAMNSGVAEVIPSKANLSYYSTPGEYYTPTIDIAGSVSNGITNPSAQSGKSFHLTVDKATDGSRVYQTLRTYEGWVFTRNYDRAASTWTPWLATAGIMHTTIKGPFHSTILLSRSANVVYAEIVGMSGGAVPGGATTDEAIPADYRPVSFTANVAGRGVIHGYWQAQVLTVISDGRLKNYGSGGYGGDGSGSWLVYNQ